MNLFDIRAQWPDQTTEDAQEVAEWRDALLSVIAHSGTAQAKQILDMLVAVASTSDIGWRPSHGTPYINTISVECQPVFPGDLAIEERLASIMRWNALAMVARANYAYGELGGHIASYASAADLFEVGFNHFFKARTESSGWRSGVLSTALGARGLCPGVPRGTPGRKGSAALSARDQRARQGCPRSVELPASLVDAGLLAVSNGLHGHRSDQLDLPGALHALSGASRPARQRRANRLGRVWRRGNG